MQPTRYQLVVAGELSPRYASAFEGMDVRAADGRTTISGVVADQPRLHRLINLVGDLGLELLDVGIVTGSSDRAEGAVR